MFTHKKMKMEDDVKVGVNVSLYYKLWKKFQDYCRKKNKTPSDEFNRFMKDTLEKEGEL